MSVSSIQDKIKELQNELSKTKYNKSTEHHFAVVKAKIAKLREKVESRIASKKGGGGGFSVKKTGDASVVFVGFPSVGKSTLLNKLTNADSRVGAYAFTTLTVKPGMLPWRGAKIQLLDVPGIVEGAASGRGRGKEVLAMIRTCNLIILLLDATHPEHYEILLRELYDANIRVNQKSPHVKITTNKTGKNSVGSTVKLTKVSKKAIMTVLQELRYTCTDVVIRENISLDQFMDVIEKNKVYIPMITVVSKVDLLTEEERKHIKKTIKPAAMISAVSGEGIPEMKDAIYDALKFMRVYLKEVGKPPDMKEPMIVRKGTTIRDICQRIHRDFVNKFHYAKLWGKSAKFPGQQFQKLGKVLRDEDIIEIHLY